MQKLVLLFVFSLSTIFNGNAQLAKKVWLVGGAGSFLASKYSYSSTASSSSSNRIDINVSSNVGYFVIDKTALGLRLGYIKFKDVVEGSGGNIQTNDNRLYIGPFARYYFLNLEKQYNLLIDVNYQHGFYMSRSINGSINTLSASFGPVIYLNSAIGLEFLLGYYSRKETIRDSWNTSNQQKGFQVSIGFQLHLDKE